MSIQVYDEKKYIANSHTTTLKPIEYVVNADGCWEVVNRWKTKRGRTKVKRWSKVIETHRYVYEDIHGEINDRNVEVRHKCDNPSCINPEHLELGTHEDNMRDMKERNRRKGKLMGAENPQARDFNKELYELVVSLLEKGLTLKGIIKETGKSQRVVQKIANNTHWSCKEYDPERIKTYSFR